MHRSKCWVHVSSLAALGRPWWDLAAPQSKKQGQWPVSLERAESGWGQPCTPHGRPSLGAAVGLSTRLLCSADTWQVLVVPGGACIGQGETPAPRRRWRCSQEWCARGVVTLNVPWAMHAHTQAQPGAPRGLTFPVLLCCSQDSDLPTLISSVHRSRHLVMPEHQSRCEFQRGSVEIGLGAAGEEPGQRWVKQGCQAAQSSVRTAALQPPCVSAQRLWMPPPPAALAGSQEVQWRRREVAKPAVPRGSV